MTQDSFQDLVLESAHNGIVAIDRDGIIRVFNKAAHEILGTGGGDFVGQHHGGLFPEVWPQLKKIMETSNEYWGHRIKVGDRAILANRSVIKKDGSVIGVVSVFSDLEEAEKVSMKLDSFRRLAKELEAIIESSYDGIYVADGEARTLRVNAAYERITGLMRSELVGKKMEELVQAGYFDRSVTLEVLKSRHPITLIQDIRGGKKVMVTGTPFHSAETGALELVVTNVRDITELNELNKELHKLRRASSFYSQELERLKGLGFFGDSLVARSPAMVSVIDSAVRSAQFQANVLLTGESGAGKGIIARLIHTMSPRKEAPFIKINCGGIPGHLIESELFGYEPGAFTGASPKGKMGLIEAADGGTVFLDEIGELPMELQASLLHVLEDQSIARVGSTRRKSVDVRFIAATNVDIGKAVKERRFREDLYYRLKVVPIEIPPLRARPEDILPMALKFLERFNVKHGKSLSFGPEALDEMLAYDFPGNVRELENVIERAGVMASGDEISTLHLFAGKNAAARLGQVNVERPLKESLAELEKAILTEAVNRYGSTYRISERLGLNQSTIVRKLQKYGLAANAIVYQRMR